MQCGINAISTCVVSWSDFSFVSGRVVVDELSFNTCRSGIVQMSHKGDRESGKLRDV